MSTTIIAALEDTARAPDAHVTFSTCWTAIEAESSGAMTSKLVVGSKLVVSKLVAASASGDVARVRELVVGSKSAATAEAAALFAAAEHDHAEVITVLRDAGAQQAKQPCGQTATWAAASVGHVDCVRALGGDAVDEVDDVCGIAPVLIASVAGFAGVVGALHSLGADLAAVDDQGNTALHLAAQHAHVDLVRALPALGADIEARNNAGQTPLFVAAQAPSNGLDASSSSSSSSSSSGAPVHRCRPCQRSSCTSCPAPCTPRTWEGRGVVGLAAEEGGEVKSTAAHSSPCPPIWRWGRCRAQRSWSCSWCVWVAAVWKEARARARGARREGRGSEKRGSVSGEEGELEGHLRGRSRAGDDIGVVQVGGWKGSRVCGAGGSSVVAHFPRKYDLP